MEIQIDPHALERAEERGTNGEEIRDVINTGLRVPARGGAREKLRSMSLNRRDTGSITSRSESKSSTQ